MLSLTALKYLHQNSPANSSNYFRAIIFMQPFQSFLINFPLNTSTMSASEKTCSSNNICSREVTKPIITKLNFYNEKKKKERKRKISAPCNLEFRDMLVNCHCQFFSKKPDIHIYLSCIHMY